MKVNELAALVGRELAPSRWITIDQQRISAFADCTDDQQFIHTDPRRAAVESPFGGTIAHGFLTLSLLAAHGPEDQPALEDLGLAVNYGLDKLRFMTPVRAGSRVRLLTQILSVEPKGPGRMLVKALKTMQIEGSEKPAYVAEQLTLFIARDGRGQGTAGAA